MKAKEAKEISKSTTSQSPDVQQEVSKYHKRIEGRARLGHTDCSAADMSPAVKAALKMDGYNITKDGIDWK